MDAQDIDVDVLLRRATADLHPPVDQLVSAGVTRGRARRRRARIGTALATVAVIGLVGTAAVAIPELGNDPRSGPGIASDGSITQVEAPPPVISPVDAALVVGAAEIPMVVDDLLGTSLAGGPLREERYEFEDRPREKRVHFRHDGMLVSVTIEVWPHAMGTCQASRTCETRTDGSLHNTWEGTVDGVTSRGASVFRHGYVVTVLSHNAADSKKSPPLAPSPPLTTEQLLQVAGSDVWFG